MSCPYVSILGSRTGENCSHFCSFVRMEFCFYSDPIWKFINIQYFSFYNAKVPLKVDHHEIFFVRWISCDQDAVSVIATWIQWGWQSWGKFLCGLNMQHDPVHTVHLTYACEKHDDWLHFGRVMELCSRQRAIVFWWKRQKEQATMTIPPSRNLLHFHI